MILVLDTETTGLPKSYKAPVSDVENWPRAVQIAWATYENDGTLVDSADYIIKPDGYEIPAEAAALHGITTERALANGRDIQSVLTELDEYMHHANYIVAHNIDFDAAVLGAEFIRAGFGNPIEFAPMICTMRASTDYCAIEGKYGNKWPNLNELHQVLFSESFEEKHNASNDVAACANCFFELVKLGVIALDVAPTPKPEPDAFTELNAEIEAEEDAAGPIAETDYTDPELLTCITVEAYEDMDQTRMTLHHCEHVLWEAQRELDAVNYELRKSEGYAACKNEQQRADYLYGNNEERAHLVEIAKVDALGSRLDFEMARDEVERVRTLLRIAELAAGIERGTK